MADELSRERQEFLDRSSQPTEPASKPQFRGFMKGAASGIRRVKEELDGLNDSLRKTRNETKTTETELTRTQQTLRKIYEEGLLFELYQAYALLADELKNNPLADPTRLGVLEDVLRRFDPNASGINFNELRQGGTDYLQKLFNQGGLP